MNQWPGRGGQCKGNRKRFFAVDATCICPQCGYSLPHTPGKPCFTQNCPVCHVPLVRSVPSSNRMIENTESRKKETLNLPKIDTSLCIGCGKCVKLCPMGAISLIDAKAFIDPDKCRNCRVCESKCPVQAIG